MCHYLHASVVDIKCEVPISHLERGGFIVNECCANNVEARDDKIPVDTDICTLMSTASYFRRRCSLTIG